ncbi:hypothetical protein SALBM311S_04053 [Streptomyces alboniger]
MSATEGATGREQHEYDDPRLPYRLSTFGVSELIRSSGSGTQRIPVEDVEGHGSACGGQNGVGVPYLAYAADLSASAAIAAGLTPFLLGDAVKAVLAMGVMPTAWKLLKH